MTLEKYLTGSDAESRQWTKYISHGSTYHFLRDTCWGATKVQILELQKDYETIGREWAEQHAAGSTLPDAVEWEHVRWLLDELPRRGLAKL